MYKGIGYGYKNCMYLKMIQNLLKEQTIKRFFLLFIFAYCHLKVVYRYRKISLNIKLFSYIFNLNFRNNRRPPTTLISC